MYAGWLISNNCYAVIFGDDLVPVNGKRFFQTIKELKEYLEPLGLTVSKTKEIIKIEEVK